MQQKRVYSAIAGLAFLASIIFFPAFNLSGQSLPLVSANSQNAPVVMLSYGKDKTLSVRPEFLPDHPEFEPVGVYPNQDLQINLQFPSSAAGQTIFVGALEDGIITTPTDSGAVILGPGGAVSIGYRAPQTPGRYNVILHINSQDYLLRFIVLSTRDAGKALRFRKAD